IEILSQQFALLPVRFASIMESADSIIKMLDRNNHNILQNLHNVENKYEYGLKIFCEPEKLMSELSLKSEVTSGISATPAPRINNSIYREWVNNKLKEHKAEELLVKYVDSVIAEITLYLGRLNAVSKIKKMTTATTIIDVALLLDKTKKEALVASVEDLQNQHAALTFVLTGPWPPYNFVEFTVK
ncbi:MAG: GvpL/GvpF family gas vesicle protein, partial [Bacteroidota bacterium]